MATKTFYATRDLKNPSGYGSRMLKAGDPVELTGPQARLYRALGAVSPQKPTAAASAPSAPQGDDLSSKTKAELVKLAGVSEAEAKKLTKAQLIERIGGA